MSRENYFEDWDQDAAGLGVFDGGGARHLEQTTRTMTPEGLVYRCVCPRCGTMNALTVRWGDEVIPIAYSYVPRGWQAGHGGMFPVLGCASCKDQIMVVITPDECQKSLKGAVSANIVSQQAIQAMAQRLRGG